MSQVMMPQKKSNSGIFQLGGALAGGILASPGGPGAIAGGAAAGASLGGLAGGALSPEKAAPQAIQSNAMNRRMAQIESDPLNQLRNAETALASVPPPVKAEYAPAIQRARMLEEQRRGLA
jgi:hypothetical protein